MTTQLCHLDLYVPRWGVGRGYILFKRATRYRCSPDSAVRWFAPPKQTSWRARAVIAGACVRKTERERGRVRVCVCINVYACVLTPLLFHTFSATN